MKRAILWLVLGAVLFAAGRALYRALASDETRIGWLLQDEVDAFHGASLLDVMPHFATDYRDDTIGIDAAMLRSGLLWAWKNECDANGRFAWHLELPDGVGALAIDGDAAHASFPLELSRGSGDPAQAIWRVQVDARFARKDGEWWIVRSSHRTLAGKAPRLPAK